MGCDHPFCRAAVSDGSVTLNSWGGGLLRHGPTAMLLRDARVGLADLHVPAHGELLVEPVPHAPWRPEHVDALMRWAANVGYRRVWLPDGPVDLDPSGVVPAAVTCPTCGLCWEDGSAEFWEIVLEDGHFPGYCLGCGGSLPEWHVASSAATAASRSRAHPTSSSAALGVQSRSS